MIERLAEFLRKRGVNLSTFGNVFDIGSRDGLQAVELSKLFGEANIVAIECNRATLERCRQNIQPYPRIKLVDKAVNSYTGRCAFYPIDQERTITTWSDGNPGASSLFVATGDYPVETYVQNEAEVDCTRLDDLCSQLKIDVIDLIWMDLQGAELLALQSAGDMLDKVRFIYTEVSHRPIYTGQCLFDDVDAFLTARGFRRCTKINRERWQQDIIYENMRELIDAMVPVGPKEFDAVELSVRSLRACVKDLRHIFLVSATDPKLSGVQFVDERSLPLNIDSVDRILGSGKHAGWYLQQLIKLTFPLTSRTSLEHVLGVDADTIFLRPCRFIENGRPILNFGDDYHAAYFEHMRRLNPALHRMFAYSGVTHCTLFKRSWLKEFHDGVLAHHAGKSFWQAYLESIDTGANAQGASESEAYFNFCLRFHASELTIRRFHWRDADAIEQLQPDDFDYLSLRRSLRQERSNWRQLVEQAIPGLPRTG